MHTDQNKPDGKTYPLRTLADVFNLPSIEHIRRCLPEVCDAIITARIGSDALVAAVRDVSPELAATIPAEAVEFPDVLNWEDDGKGSAELDFEEDGRGVLLTISNKEGQ
jgi:hypothetical protein